MLMEVEIEDLGTTVCVCVFYKRLFSSPFCIDDIYVLRFGCISKFMMERQYKSNLLLFDVINGNAFVFIPSSNAYIAPLHLHPHPFMVLSIDCRVVGKLLEKL